ncbi:MAG: ribonuclease H-like domain-containing protein [Desulfamplus sp.]|nr:ribonuclease H-like domain-containing protein [Desulfamplus sp.]
MLKNTFHHMPGIGLKTERKLWNSGITSWEDLQDSTLNGVSPQRLGTLLKYAHESMSHLENLNFKYFGSLLPASLHWRFFPEVRKNAVYLDIETTGMEMYDKITTIALYDGRDIKYYVNGENLDLFPDAVKEYEAVITYNGKCFDIPFIENFFGITMPHAHIDLRYILKSLGLGGGLKGCEKKMGISRGDLDGIDGFFAVRLWNDYKKRGSIKSLETLLAYNIEDVVNLEILMVMAYNQKIRETPFAATHEIAMPPRVEVPFKADMATVKKLRLW